MTMSDDRTVERYDAIVVGAGIAGCTIGLLLADAGKKVLILEKSGDIGGRCRTFTHQGYVLDLGGHLLEDGAVTALHERFGIEIDMPKTTDIKLWWDGRWTNPKELYLNDRDELRKISEELISMSWDDIDKLDDALLVDWLRTRTQSQGIIELFGMLGVLDYMIDYEEISASEALAMRKLTLEERGVIGFSQYPTGGTMGLVRPVAEAFKKRSGEIRTHCEVSKVCTDNGLVNGVEISQPNILPNEISSRLKIESDVVILTAPLWNLEKLLPDACPGWYTQKINYMGAQRGGWFGFHAACDKSIVGLTLYGFDTLPRSGLRGGGLEPSAYDAGMAPEGMHLVQLSGTNEEYDARKSDKSWLCKKMAEFEMDMEEMFPDLKTHCLWKRWFEVGNFGILQKPGLVGHAKPGYEIPGVKNLYYASDSAKSRGMGIDAATRVAISVVERILGSKFPEFKDIFHY